MSKEFLLETAQARNKVALPRVLQNEWGVRLPSERFVLTGVPWGLKGQWVVNEEDESVSGAPAGDGVDIEMGEGEDGRDEEGEGRMEDLFGADGDVDEDMDKDD